MKDTQFQDISEEPIRTTSPRICMPTWRNFRQKTYRCSRYEAQDVLVEIDDVDLIPLEMAWGSWFPENWLIRPLYHDVSRKLIFANPGLKKVKLTRNYDIFIAVCTTIWDITYINAIERWREHCKISVCWIDELWAAAIPAHKYWLHALAQFDYVFIGYRDTVPALSQAVDRSCYWLPGGIDALRFGRFANEAARVIDIYSIGRRAEGIHHALLKEARLGKRFYIYDTQVNVANMEVHDHRQHRDLFALMANRSRYFIVAPAKFDAFDETRGQVEIGYRYYEGAAAGTVMIGETPECDAYRELFGWPEAVIPIKPDGSDVMAVISDLDSDLNRVAAISRRNRKEALLHHDWVYRWKEMFRVVAIDPTPRMAARERRLTNMADLPARGDKEDATDVH